MPRSHHITRTTRTTVAALGLTALALTGCSAIDQQGGGTNGGGNGAAGGTNGGNAETGGATDAAGTAGLGTTVTIMTHDSFNITEEQITAFEEQTGYALQTTAPGDAGAVVNQLLLAQDSPTVDGVYGVENFSTRTLTDAAVLDPYTPENLPESAEELMVEDQLTPIDQGQVCVNIDHEWFDEQGLTEPQTLEDLTEPQYAELLVVTNPVTSSPGLAFLAATVTEAGEDGWQDYWQQLLDGGTRVAAGWSDAYYSDFSGSEGAGEFPLVLSYSSSPAAEPATGVLEGTCTPQVEYAGVVDGAQNPAGAQAFIDFMLTEQVQAQLPETMFMYPIDESVELPAEWTEHAQLAEDPIVPDVDAVAENREAWLREWTSLYESAS